MKRLFALLPLLAVAACGNWQLPTRADGDIPRKGTIIPATTLRISPSISVALEKVIIWGGLAGAAYLVLDPWAPNWSIEEAPIGDQYVHFSLKMKRYYAGGAGEARAVFNHRAKELQRLNEFDGYEVVEYTESLDSSVIGSRRTAEGVIRLTGRTKALPPA